MGCEADLSRNARMAVPYVRSGVLPGDFRPITSYLFVEIQVQPGLLVLLVLR
jgi:hypothetical protein